MRAGDGVGYAGRDMGALRELVVVGAGHAGCEAAHAAARLGCAVTVVTLRRDRIGWMSCNPAIGGMAKGHLVREIDALGGLMGRVTDATAIQVRTLNTRRGPAVRGTRAQVDRRRYARTMARMLLATPGVTLREGMVTEVLVEGRGAGRRVVGVRLEDGSELPGAAVVVTAGTFLNGLAHVGEVRTACGREGDRPAVGLSASLSALGLTLGRFKTGTTPRLDGRTLDLARLEAQPGEAAPRPFSHGTDPARFPVLPQRPCHLTHTTEATHRLVRENLRRSPLFTGAILGTGPRYCPSIEDKVQRFAERSAHPVYLEPDGLDTDEVYPGGISTSLPAEVQQAMLRTLPGLEAVEILRPGYAIEYDYVPPTQVEATLAAKGLQGARSRGPGERHLRVRGGRGPGAARWGERRAGPGRGRPRCGSAGTRPTSGSWSMTSPPWHPGKLNRMLTSRAEHRLQLREDNADLRLSALGHAVGLVTDAAAARAAARGAAVAREVARLEGTPVGGAGGRGPSTLASVLRRPEVSYASLAGRDPGRPALDPATVATVEVEVKYRGYIDRAARRLAAVDALDETEIPSGFPFTELAGLSAEVQETFLRHQPRTLGQAGRISGVTPAAVDSSPLTSFGRGVPVDDLWTNIRGPIWRSVSLGQMMFHVEHPVWTARG